MLHAAQRLDAAVAAGTAGASADPSGASDPTASPVARDVAIAKARAGHSTTMAVQEGVQMHGGMGMTEDLDFGLFMKRARVLQELFGDSDFQADRVARLASY